MKKILIILALFPFALRAQKLVTLAASQVSISSMAPIAGGTLVGNPTGSSATPVALPLGIGLTFSGGKLAIDTANFKDTIFAVNGLSIIGSSMSTIGLGGRLQQNTNISGANLYAMTIDSMQAGSGRGFRVNFGSDAGYDMFYRDSATGFWTRVAKGTPGQVLTMSGLGGIAWGTLSGGGSAITLTTTGTSGAATLISSVLNIPNYSPSVGAFSGSSITNGGSFTGSVLTFGPADGTNPGMVTTGAQTLAGVKTFTSAPILTTSSTVGYVWTATGTGGQGGWAAAGGGGGQYIGFHPVATGNYTITATSGLNYIVLPDLTGQANRNIVLQSAPTDGTIYEFKNNNTTASTFNWIFTNATVKDYGNNTITTLTALTYYQLVWDATASLYYIRN